MKKIVLMTAIAMLLAAATVHAAGDLTVSGNLTVSGDIIADKKFQAASIPHTSTAWTTVIFPVSFNSTPVVVASGAKPAAGASINFFVVLRNVTPTSFEFRAINHDNTVHAVNAGCTVSTTAPCDSVHWIAMVP